MTNVVFSHLVDRAAPDQAYCNARTTLLATHDLKYWAISRHLADIVGQTLSLNGQPFCPARRVRSPATVSLVAGFRRYNRLLPSEAAPHRAPPC